MLAVADRLTLPHIPPTRLVNIVQACELAGVSRRSIYYWIEAGKVKTVRTAGGRLRIYADSLFRRSTL